MTRTQFIKRLLVEGLSLERVEKLLSDLDGMLILVPEVVQITATVRPAPKRTMM